MALAGSRAGSVWAEPLQKRAEPPKVGSLAKRAEPLQSKPKPGSDQAQLGSARVQP